MQLAPQRQGPNVAAMTSPSPTETAAWHAARAIALDDEADRRRVAGDDLDVILDFVRRADWHRAQA